MVIVSRGDLLPEVGIGEVIPASISVGLLIVRTQLEDSVLESELEGYRDYQSVTRYRLLPGLW